MHQAFVRNDAPPNAVRLPAEWEPQSRLYLVYPRDPLTWPDRVEVVRARFLEVIERVAPHQEVFLLAHPDTASEALEATRGMANVMVIKVHHQDSWIRDYGPLTVATPEGLRHIKFTFDSWGGKYEALLKDNFVVPQLEAGQVLQHPVLVAPPVLEGGAVETNGQGLFLATESVAEGRNQTKAEHEAILRDWLGAKDVLWLGEGIQGDDTDGHIDTLTRFVGPRIVVTSVADPDHPDHDALQANLERLEAYRFPDGAALEVHPLPCPEPVHTDEGDPLPAGHANFLITNGVTLVPGFGGPSDEVARALLERLIGRPAVLVDHRDMIWGFGGIHCLSMQVPA